MLILAFYVVIEDMHEIIRIHKSDKFYYLTHCALLIEELNKVLGKYSYIYICNYIILYYYIRNVTILISKNK